MKTRTGRVKYTKRAFHQDAVEAMRGDIVRGLIEAITNSDDAYGEHAPHGKIRVEVEHRHGTWKAIVRDRATGMWAEELERKIGGLGERTSGFESGASVRGNLGRGAKDLAAFGTVIFESIKDGRISKLTLESTGDFTIDKERKAPQSDRVRLGIPRGNGTVVTIQVAETVRCPRHERLVDKLSQHFQLRNIVCDPRRELQLMNLNTGATSTLRYSQPSLDVVFEDEVSIEGYEGVTAKVIIHRNPERYDDPASDPGRPGGILVCGKRACYENTLFGCESDPHAGWFSGRVECSYLDTLAREYDDCLVGNLTPPDTNPIPIIRRGRDSLQRAHPFYKALAKAIEQPLNHLVDEERRKAKEGGSRESSAMRRCLDALGRDLARLFKEDLTEIEQDVPPLDSPSGENLPLIKIIPEDAVLYIGEDKTFTVYVSATRGPDIARAEVDPEGVVELIDGGDIALSPHSKRQDILVGRVRVRPILEDKETLLSVTFGEHVAVAVLEVRPGRVIEEEQVVPPDSLQFERDSYRVAWTKQKKLRIMAPVELVAEHGSELRLHSSEEGVVVMGGGAELVFDDKVEYFSGEVLIDARTLGAKATLMARLGSAEATCNVYVARDEGGEAMQISVADEEAGHRRALVEQAEGQLTIRVMGRHPAIKRYLGPGPELKGQDMGVSRALIAEIVAGEVTRMVMEKRFGSTIGADLLDTPAMYVEHSRYLSKYLTRCHRQLVPESALTSAK